MTEPLYSERRHRYAPTLAERLAMKAARQAREARGVAAASEVVALQDDDFPELREAMRLFPGNGTLRTFAAETEAYAVNGLTRPYGQTQGDFRQQVIQSLALTMLDRRCRIARSRPNVECFAPLWLPLPIEPHGDWRARVTAPMPDGFTWEHGFTTAGAS